MHGPRPPPSLPLPSSLFPLPRINHWTEGPESVLPERRSNEAVGEHGVAPSCLGWLPMETLAGPSLGLCHTVRNTAAYPLILTGQIGLET